MLFPAHAAIMKASDAKSHLDDVSGKVPALKNTATPNPFSLVIFGASGDLTSRKLMPALFNLFREKRLPDVFHIIGFARREKTDDAFRQEMKDAVHKYSRVQPSSESEWDAFAKNLFYYTGEMADEQAYAGLKNRLKLMPGSREVGHHHLFYLATAPEFFEVVPRCLNASGLVRRDGVTKLVVEKPFGVDSESAGHLNAALQAEISEKSIYRIDHYLGKETIQNLLYFRFANSIYEPLWDRRYIDCVQITVAEEEGVGTRGGYYDKSGALRDMLQNHMMQILTLVAMEPPASLDPESLRDEKVKVLRCINGCCREGLASQVVRARYEGYRNEEKVSPESMTETYTAVKLFVDNWRWAGVPFYLRTGKFLKRRVSQIDIVFRKPPSILFHAQTETSAAKNVLSIRLQPSEGIHLRFNAKALAEAHLQEVGMDFCYRTEFGSYSPEAYERLLRDAMIGDATLFIRADEVREAWRIMDSIRKQWDALPMYVYPKQSWGPQESFQMLENDGNDWVLGDGFNERCPC